MFHNQMEGITDNSVSSSCGFAVLAGWLLLVTRTANLQMSEAEIYLLCDM